MTAATVKREAAKTGVPPGKQVARQAVAGKGGQRRDPGSKVLPTAWAPSNEMELEEWVLAGRKFGQISRCSQWWIGDWICFGNAKWGEKYIEAARITGYDVASLRNMASVARQIPPSLRSDKLSYSHHALLTSLPDPEKRAWIRRAIADRLSVADLRLELRGRPSRNPSGDEHADGEAPLNEGADRSLGICPQCGQRVPAEAAEMATKEG